MARVGILVGLAADDPETKANVAAFLQGMQERGWSEGRNVQFDYRWAGPDAERIRADAAELVSAQPDVIFTFVSPSVAALRQATRTIPIVFACIGDPVGQGFVASLARPGGNITGFTGLEFSLGEKWVGFLKELAPNITRVAFLFHPEMGPYYSNWLKSVEASATALGIDVAPAPVRMVADIERAIARLLPDRARIENNVNRRVQSSRRTAGIRWRSFAGGCIGPRHRSCSNRRSGF
jgi:putative ABC transport system substrate-binding protein